MAGAKRRPLFITTSEDPKWVTLLSISSERSRNKGSSHFTFITTSEDAKWVTLLSISSERSRSKGSIPRPLGR